MHNRPLHDVLQAIILLGVIQGLTAGILLWNRREYRRPNRILATIIFLFALSCFNLYGENEN
ncbi:MAG TPA: hypothetical protein VK772_01040, partial [Puia sp.]|nr:hypothetical protein [Puia sp.]